MTVKLGMKPHPAQCQLTRDLLSNGTKCILAGPVGSKAAKRLKSLAILLMKQ